MARSPKRKAISFRTPYQTRSPTCATGSTPGKTRFCDMHLSLMPQVTRYGFLGPGGLGRGGSLRCHRGRRHRADLAVGAAPTVLQSGREDPHRTESPPSADAARACTISTSRPIRRIAADSDLRSLRPHRLADDHGRPVEDRRHRGDRSRGRGARLQRPDSPSPKRIGHNVAEFLAGQLCAAAASPSRFPADCNRAWATSPTRVLAALGSTSRDPAVRDVHRGAAGFRGRAAGDRSA